MVEGNSEDGETEPSTTTTTNDHSITFLYTLGPGTCPKSFGINVARLASLPAEVLDNAKRVSQEFEAEMVAAHLRHQDSSVKEKVLAAINKGDWDELERLWHEMKSASS
jgi:DNA mismatch repair protein MSH6